MGPDVKLLKRIVRSIRRDIQRIIRGKAQQLHPAAQPADIRKRWTQRVAQFAGLLGLDLSRCHISEVARDQITDKNQSRRFGQIQTDIRLKWMSEENTRFEPARMRLESAV